MFFVIKHKTIKLRAALSVFLAVLFAVSLLSPLLEVKAEGEAIFPEGPDISASAAIVIEANTGVILYKRDAYTAYQPANISQLMTALLTVENASANDIMTMSAKAETATTGSRVGLTRRESITVESALYAVLLASGNEVAYGLSEMISGDRDLFVDLMNKRADELELLNTHFTSPEGSDDAEHYTCAYDMAMLARKVFANPLLRKITGSAKYTIPATNLKEARPINNRHQMVRGAVTYKPVLAGKVGYSAPAGYTGVTLVEKDGTELICVILNAKSQDAMYDEIKKICNWCFDNFKSYNIQENELGGNSVFSTLFTQTPQFSVEKSEAIVSFDSGSVVIVPSSVQFSEITRSVNFYELKEYKHGDNVIGSIVYTYGGIFVGSAEIVYYNNGYPMNSEVFKERWPEFLFSPDVVLTEEHRAVLNEYLGLGNISPTPVPTEAITVTPAPSPTLTPAQISANRINSFRRWVIIGSGIVMVVILLVVYLVVFEIPYKKKNKDW